MTTPTKPKKLATVKEVAQTYRVSEKTVYRWVKTKTVDVRRVGPTKCIRIVMHDDFSASAQ